jgi:hypothetical protein
MSVQPYISPDMKDSFEERAAIIQFCAGKSRADAEKLAHCFAICKKNEAAQKECFHMKTICPKIVERMGW